MGIFMAKWQRAMYQPNINLGETGEKVTASKEHIELSKNAAKEGMVLLKNDNNLLPLKRGTKVALFGKGTFDYVKGGGGSGDVTVSYTVNMYDGLKSLNDYVVINEELSDFYSEYVKNKYADKKEPGLLKEPILEECYYKNAKEFADVAIISICRFSGEGWDRKSQYDKKSDDDNSKKDDLLFEDGDFYLSANEKILVEKVKAYFDDIIVVLNVGGVVDTSWFSEDKKISSVLLALQGGIEGGTAAAELLCGITTPSGKLADTFARKLENYPSSYNFHESDDYVDYTEDIYVGYRYFETLENANDMVIYPFGYGLSYTTFSYELLNASEKNGLINLNVLVKNTGFREGKEVIQVYGSKTTTSLGYPSRSLIDFKKTCTLKPGEGQNLTFEFNINELASYDDLGKIQKSAYVLEKSTLSFYVGNSVRDAKKIDFEYQVLEDRIIEQLTSKIAPTALKQRMIEDGSYEVLPQSISNNPNSYDLDELIKEELDGFTPTVRALPGVCLWKNPFKDGIKILKEVVDCNISVGEFLSQMTDEEIAHLLGGQPNTSCANTFGIGNMPEYGVPNIMTADGPAGLRIAPECGIYTTAWPCATLLACTWNKDIVYEVGKAGAKEVKENNISVWLTPAINIHRSPLCGRNFEYYSEDPILTGVLASSMVKGIQSQNIAATVKHFALNNKETNRKNSDSRVSERAAREIYLKPFEIIVKNANPWCIMTSYNIINGHRASECKELIDGILREEWGFNGMVTSDWWTLGEHYKEVLAGNDLKMACGYKERLLEAKEKGLITRSDLEKCAAKIIELILKID